MVGLLGPNGAGKTTLLKIIATLIHPTRGHVKFFGRDNRDDEIKSRGLLGMVTSEERSFYWRLSGRANLMFFATLYGMGRREATKRIEELLATLDLTYAADQRFDGYSSGMKQKLAIARGLLSDPEIILYDEPTRSLDPLSQQNIRNWIKKGRVRRPEQTHLITTHNLTEAAQLCDRIIILNRGRVVAQGTMGEIRQHLAEEFSSHVITFSGPAAPTLPQLSALEGVIDIQNLGSFDNMGSIRVTADAGGRGLSRVLQCLLQSNAHVVQCDHHEKSLEDLFCAVIQSDVERSSR